MDVEQQIPVEGEIVRWLDGQQLPGESKSDLLRRLLNLPRSNEDRRVAALLVEIARQGVSSDSTVTRRYLLVLASLHAQNPERFQQVLGVYGGRRVYFARSREDIDSSGTRAWPRRIPGTPFWALTNLNTPRKGRILNRVLERLGYQETAKVKVLGVLAQGMSRQVMRDYEVQRRRQAVEKPVSSRWG